jgi:hypothetical protein
MAGYHHQKLLVLQRESVVEAAFERQGSDHLTPIFERHNQL